MFLMLKPSQELPTTVEKFFTITISNCSLHFVWRKFLFSLKFLQYCLLSTFSCLNVMYLMKKSSPKIFTSCSTIFHTVGICFATNTANCSVSLIHSFHFGLMKIPFLIQNSCKIVFALLISNQNDLISICKIDSTQMKWVSSKTILFIPRSPWWTH